MADLQGFSDVFSDVAGPNFSRKPEQEYRIRHIVRLSTNYYALIYTIAMAQTSEDLVNL